MIFNSPLYSIKQEIEINLPALPLTSPTLSKTDERAMTTLEAKNSKSEKKRVSFSQTNQIIIIEQSEEFKICTKSIDQIAHYLLRKITNKKVSFAETSSVILIPIRDEFKERGLDSKIWYTQDERREMKENEREGKFWGNKEDEN